MDRAWDNYVLLDAEVVRGCSIFTVAHHSHLAWSELNGVAAELRHEPCIAEEDSAFAEWLLYLRKQRHLNTGDILCGVHDDIHAAVRVRCTEAVGLHFSGDTAEALDSALGLKVE